MLGIELIHRLLVFRRGLHVPLNVLHADVPALLLGERSAEFLLGLFQGRVPHEVSVQVDPLLLGHVRVGHRGNLLQVPVGILPEHRPTAAALEERAWSLPRSCSK